MLVTFKLILIKTKILALVGKTEHPHTLRTKPGLFLFRGCSCMDKTIID
jgi:hypothetical protein